MKCYHPCMIPTAVHLAGYTTDESSYKTTHSRANYRHRLAQSKDLNIASRNLLRNVLIVWVLSCCGLFGQHLLPTVRQPKSLSTSEPDAARLLTNTPNHTLAFEHRSPPSLLLYLCGTICQDCMTQESLQGHSGRMWLRFSPCVRQRCCWWGSKRLQWRMCTILLRQGGPGYIFNPVSGFSLSLSLTKFSEQNFRLRSFNFFFFHPLTCPLLNCIAVSPCRGIFKLSTQTKTQKKLIKDFGPVFQVHFSEYCLHSYEVVSLLNNRKLIWFYTSAERLAICRNSLPCMKMHVNRWSLACTKNRYVIVIC